MYLGADLSEAQRTRLVCINNEILAALRSEARRALLANSRAGWPAAIGDIRNLASEIELGMAKKAQFDKALAAFVANELRELAAEIRNNINLREAPQWPN